MDENYPYEGDYEDPRFEMYSKRSGLKTKALIYGVIFLAVFGLILPWAVGLVEIIGWFF